MLIKQHIYIYLNKIQRSVLIKNHIQTWMLDGADPFTDLHNTTYHADQKHILTPETILQSILIKTFQQDVSVRKGRFFINNNHV